MSTKLLWSANFINMSLILDSLFSSVAFSHLIVDLLNGQRPILLTYLSGPLGMTNAVLGLVSTIYMMAGSLTQPIFGYLADRFGPRWIIAGGVLWMAVFFSLAVGVTGQSTLILLVLASLGSGAFHPAGTMQAILRGRTHFAGRETTSAAYFFLFGQVGFFLGPMVGGLILDRYGPMGLLALTVLAVPIGINVAIQFQKTFPQRLVGTSESGEIDSSNRRTSLGEAKRFRVLPLLAFVLLAAFQAWAQQNMITFVPKYLSDLGQSASTYGLVAALFMGGSALGNILGGNLADRFGKIRVTTISLALASVPIFFLGSIEWSFWHYLLIPLAGSLTGATHSIIVVWAQRLIPGGMGLASGVILGFMFTSGAVGTLLSGYLADLWGLPLVFQLTAGIALAGSVLAISLREA